MENRDKLLEVKNLSVCYSTRDIGICRAVNDVSFDLAKGETIGLVGETGAGKTTIALSIMRLLQSPPGEVTSGSIVFDGKNILDMSDSEIRKIRGEEISMIFQDPMTALNPIDYVGDQISEAILLHRDVSSKQAMEMAGDMMEIVGIPRERYHEYPHQFSGGMKQRIVIAIALACNPRLLLADEPTTALDVTIQAQILELINNLRTERGTSVLLITHDLGVVAHMCDKVMVIYAGEIVEYGTAIQIFDEVAHPYTKALFNSLPSIGSGNRLHPIEGLMPDPADLPSGCYFSPRCKHCSENCRQKHPGLVDIGNGHLVRCFEAEKGGQL